MVVDYTELHNRLLRDGTILMELGEHPLSVEEMRRLDELSGPQSVPYERVQVGDAGERNYVDVARFMTDVEESVFVNPHASHEVISILGSPKMMDFYRQITGYDDLVIRRCQVNVLEEGGFVGLHLDIDSNPDYISPVVLQFSADYDGGDYIVYHDTHGPQAFRMKRYSMIISQCNLPHEVTPLTRGKRKSLVFFLSQHKGKNRRWEKGRTAGYGDGDLYRGDSNRAY